MTSAITTSANKSIRASDFIYSVGSNNYYIFLGNSTNLSDNILPDINDNVNDTEVDVYRNMICGKSIQDTDVSLVVRNIPYVANTVYDMYDDSDEDLDSKDFYVVVNEESYYHVYKCLDNNGGAPSTAQPMFAAISAVNGTIYQTSDGYRWKYLYSIDSTTYDKFSSVYFVPITPNTSVQEQAVSGSIDIILVENSGSRYDNYITGTFKADDLRINGNTQLYAISNTIASTVNGFYTGCLLYISSGAGISENRIISDYICNENGNFIVLNTGLTSPQNGSQYEIYPNVLVSDVNQTIDVVARALVNASSSNSIYRIELLERGAGYDQQPVSATVVANTAVPVKQDAVLRIVYSPPKGHGYNPARELYCNSAAVSVTINNQSNTLVMTNQFRQIGILANPTFGNVIFTYSASDGSFQTGETFYNVRKIKIADNASINTTSVIVNCNDAIFTEQVDINEMLLIMADDGSGQALINVASITNSTQINCQSNGLFSSSSCQVYKIVVNATGVVDSLLTATSFIANTVSPNFVQNTSIIGLVSGKIATINTITRNDISKGFDTFIQMYSYTGIIGSGSFVQNENVSEGNTLGSLFAVTNNGSNSTVYVSNQSGLFVQGGTLVGQTSAAVLNIANSYSPELEYGAGDIIYLEDVDPVPLTVNANTENIKVQVYFAF
jgi:hypothetical protein